MLAASTLLLVEGQNILRNRYVFEIFYLPINIANKTCFKARISQIYVIFTTGYTSLFLVVSSTCTTISFGIDQMQCITADWSPNANTDDESSLF